MARFALLICFLIAALGTPASGARQQLRSEVVYNERNHKEGRYQYGYAVKKGESQFHHQRSLDGAMYGCYGYVDPVGKLFITHYLADMAGYRLVNMANPDRKLVERISNLGTAENPVDLQNLFPLECQEDGDIKTLQETAQQMRNSLSTENSQGFTLPSSQSFGDRKRSGLGVEEKASDKTVVSVDGANSEASAIRTTMRGSLRGTVKTEDSNNKGLDSASKSKEHSATTGSLDATVETTKDTGLNTKLVNNGGLSVVDGPTISIQKQKSTDLSVGSGSRGSTVYDANNGFNQASVGITQKNSVAGSTGISNQIPRTVVRTNQIDAQPIEYGTRLPAQEAESSISPSGTTQSSEDVESTVADFKNTGAMAAQTKPSDTSDYATKKRVPQKQSYTSSSTGVNTRRFNGVRYGSGSQHVGADGSSYIRVAVVDPYTQITGISSPRKTSSTSVRSGSNRVGGIIHKQEVTGSQAVDAGSTAALKTKKNSEESEGTDKESVKFSSNENAITAVNTKLTALKTIEESQNATKTTNTESAEASYYTANKNTDSDQTAEEEGSHVKVLNKEFLETADQSIGNGPSTPTKLLKQFFKLKQSESMFDGERSIEDSSQDATMKEVLQDPVSDNFSNNFNGFMDQLFSNLQATYEQQKALNDSKAEAEKNWIDQGQKSSPAQATGETYSNVRGTSPEGSLESRLTFTAKIKNPVNEQKSDANVENVSGVKQFNPFEPVIGTLSNFTTSLGSTLMTAFGETNSSKADNTTLTEKTLNINENTSSFDKSAESNSDAISVEDVKYSGEKSVGAQMDYSEHSFNQLSTIKTEDTGKKHELVSAAGTVNRGNVKYDSKGTKEAFNYSNRKTSSHEPSSGVKITKTESKADSPQSADKDSLESDSLEKFLEEDDSLEEMKAVLDDMSDESESEDMTTVQPMEEPTTVEYSNPFEQLGQLFANLQTVFGAFVPSVNISSSSDTEEATTATVVANKEDKSNEVVTVDESEVSEDMTTVQPVKEPATVEFVNPFEQLGQLVSNLNTAFGTFVPSINSSHSSGTEMITNSSMEVNNENSSSESVKDDKSETKVEITTMNSEQENGTVDHSNPFEQFSQLVSSLHSVFGAFVPGTNGSINSELEMVQTSLDEKTKDHESTEELINDDRTEVNLNEVMTTVQPEHEAATEQYTFTYGQIGNFFTRLVSNLTTAFDTVSPEHVSELNSSEQEISTDNLVEPMTTVTSLNVAQEITDTKQGLSRTTSSVHQDMNSGNGESGIIQRGNVKYADYAPTSMKDVLDRKSVPNVQISTKKVDSKISLDVKNDVHKIEELEAHANSATEKISNDVKMIGQDRVKTSSEVNKKGTTEVTRVEFFNRSGMHTAHQIKHHGEAVVENAMPLDSNSSTENIEGTDRGPITYGSSSYGSSMNHATNTRPNQNKESKITSVRNYGASSKLSAIEEPVKQDSFESTKNSSEGLLRYFVPGISRPAVQVHWKYSTQIKPDGYGDALPTNSQSRIGPLPALEPILTETEPINTISAEQFSQDYIRGMVPKLPATPRPTTEGNVDAITVTHKLPSFTDRTPVTPRPTTNFKPGIPSYYFQATTASTVVRTGTSVGPNGDIYDEIEEELDPLPIGQRPTLMSPQIPPSPANTSGPSSTPPSTGPIVAIEQSISSHCYEVILQIPSDARQVIIKTDASSFRVLGDGEPEERIRLIESGVYEVNVGATSGIKFAPYQQFPQNEANKIQLDMGNGFNYGDLVPKPEFNPTYQQVARADLSGLNNPYLPLVAAPAQSRSATRPVAALVPVFEEDKVLTSEQQALLSLVPSWKKVLLYY